MSIGSKHKVGQRCFNPTNLTKSSKKTATEFKNEVDINTIFRKLKGRGYNLDQMRARLGSFVDFENGPVKDFTLSGITLTEAHNLVREAHEAFECLPLGFRKELDHDPMRLASAPRELYEKYSLIKKRDDTGGNPPEAPVSRQGSGESVPGKAPKEQKIKESSEKDDK